MPANNEDEGHYIQQHHDDHGFASNPRSCISPSTLPTQSAKRNPNFISLLLKAAIMVFIISLFFFCLGIAAIAFLHFLAAGRRRSSLLSIDSPSTAVSYSPEEIQKSLPGANYTGGGSSEKECAVCLENFAAGDWCRSLPACRHMFHASCVDKWLVKAANCPVCRTRVRLDHGSIRSDMGDDERDLLWAIRV